MLEATDCGRRVAPADAKSSYRTAEIMQVFKLTVSVSEFGLFLKTENTPRR